MTILLKRKIPPNNYTADCSAEAAFENLNENLYSFSTDIINDTIYNKFSISQTPINKIDILSSTRESFGSNSPISEITIIDQRERSARCPPAKHPKDAKLSQKKPRAVQSSILDRNRTTDTKKPTRAVTSIKKSATFVKSNQTIDNKKKLDPIKTTKTQKSSAEASATKEKKKIVEEHLDQKENLAKPVHKRTTRNGKWQEIMEKIEAGKARDKLKKRAEVKPRVYENMKAPVVPRRCTSAISSNKTLQNKDTNR